MDPVTIGLLTSALSAGYKGIQGGIQTRQANQALKALEGQEPSIYVPSAIRQRAQEPIAREFMSAQEESEARRTAQSVGALQKAGSRGIIGGLSGVMDAERASERNRMAGYEQERRGALGDLGRAEMDVQNRSMSNYLSKIQAAARAKEAGQQNIAGALDTVSQAGQQVLSLGLQGKIGSLPKTTTTTTDALPASAPTTQTSLETSSPEGITLDDVKKAEPLPQLPKSRPRLDIPNTPDIQDNTPMEQPDVLLNDDEIQTLEDAAETINNPMKLPKSERRPTLDTLGGIEDIGTEMEQGVPDPEMEKITEDLQRAGEAITKSKTKAKTNLTPSQKQTYLDAFNTVNRLKGSKKTLTPSIAKKYYDAIKLIQKFQ